MKKRLLLYGALLLLGSRASQAQSQMKSIVDEATLLNAGYELVFFDEFDYPTIDDLTTEGKWRLQTNISDGIKDNTDPVYWNPNDVKVMREGTIGYLQLNFTSYGAVGLVPPAPVVCPTKTPPDPAPTFPFKTSSGVVIANYAYEGMNGTRLDTDLEEGQANAISQAACPTAPGALRFGIIEIKARMDNAKGEGMQTAFWLHAGPGSNGSGNCDRDPQFTYQTNNNESPGWEIDGFEAIKKGGKHSFFSTIQGNPYNNLSPISTFHDIDASVDGWHTYTIAWTPTEVSWARDGVVYRTDDYTPGVPNMPMLLHLSAHFRSWVTGSGHFDIDYVKIYKPKVQNLQGTSWPEYKESVAWQKDGTVLAQTGNESPVVPEVAMVVDPVTDNSPKRLFFTKENGITSAPSRALHFVEYKPKNGTTPGTWSPNVEGTGCSNVSPASNLLAVQGSGHVFYVGTDHNLWAYSNSSLNGPFGASSFNPNNDNPSSSASPAEGNLAFDHANGRIYYTTTNGPVFGRELYYYQYDKNSYPQWRWGNTYMNHVEGPLKVLNGRLYYKKASFNQIWDYAKDVNGIWIERALPNGPTDVGQILDVTAATSVTTGDKIFYRSTDPDQSKDGKLKYVENTTYWENYKQGVASGCNYDLLHPKFSPCPNLNGPGGTCDPQWVTSSTNVALGPNSSFVTFNNQLFFISNELYTRGTVAQVRHFKVFDGYNKMITPSSLPVDILKNAAGTAQSGLVVKIFGVDNEDLFYMDSFGWINRVHCNERLNPVTNYYDADNPAYYAYDYRAAGITATKKALTESRNKIIVAYPNPATDKITFQSSVGAITSIEIFTIVGQKVTRKVTDNATVDFDTSLLPAGSYFYIITSKNATGTSVGRFQKSL